MIYKILMPIKIAFLLRKNRKLFAEKKYTKISLNLKKIHNIFRNSNKPLDKSYLYWLQKVDLNFRTHNLSEIEKDINIALKSVDYTSKRVSEDIKKYRKVFLYSIYFLVVSLNDNRKKASEIKSFIKELSRGVEGLPENILFDRTIYFKERIIKLFEDDVYYKKNYSQEKLNQIIIDMENLDKHTDKFFQKIEKKNFQISLNQLIKTTLLIFFPLTLFIFLMYKGMLLLSVSFLFLWIVGLYIYNEYINR